MIIFFNYITTSSLHLTSIDLHCSSIIPIILQSEPVFLWNYLQCYIFQVNLLPCKMIKIIHIIHNFQMHTQPSTLCVHPLKCNIGRDQNGILFFSMCFFIKIFSTMITIILFFSPYYRMHQFFYIYNFNCSSFFSGNICFDGKIFPIIDKLNAFSLQCDAY